MHRCLRKTVSGEDNPVATIPFVKGRNLSEIFDKLAEKGDREGFKELYREFEARIKGKEEYPFSDRDMVFSNILVDGDTWTLIDYEWTVNEAIPAKRQAARALYCHALERGFSGFETMDFIVGLSGLSREEFDSIIADEALFQREVNGERLTMGQIKQKIGNATADFTKYEAENRRLKIVSVYDNIPAQLNKQNRKFNFTMLDKELKFDRYEESFLWLKDAAVAIPSYIVAGFQGPLQMSKETNVFKNS